jgi:hypothetical protein
VIKLLNYTGYIVNFQKDGKIINMLKPKGHALCKTIKSHKVIGFTTNKIPIHKDITTPITGLPDPQKDVFYIVDYLVAYAAKGTRKDLLVLSGWKFNYEEKVLACESLLFL